MPPAADVGAYDHLPFQSLYYYIRYFCKKSFFYSKNFEKRGKSLEKGAGKLPNLHGTEGFAHYLHGNGTCGDIHHPSGEFIGMFLRNQGPEHHVGAVFRIG